MKNDSSNFARSARRLSAPVALALLTLATVSACVNQTKEVLTYRKVLDGPNAKVPATQPAPLPATLTLTDALHRANDNNDQLAITGEDYVIALIDKTRAAETFLPTVSFAPNFVNYDKFAEPSFGPATSGFDFSKFYPEHYIDLPMNATVKTDLVQDLYAVSRAARTVKQRQALLLDLQSNTFLNVAQTYYAILQAEQSVHTLTISAKVQEARVTNMTHRAQQGVARRLDVLQTQADAADTRVQLTNARNDVIHGRATLAYLIGVPTVDKPLADQFNPPATLPTTDELLATARAHRQDLRAAAEAVRAAASGVRSAWGQYFPSLNFNLNAFLYRESFPQNSWWTSMVTLNLPIFEEQVIHNNVRQAYATLRQSITRARQTDHQVNEDLRTAVADFYTARDRIKDLEIEARSASDAYDASAHAFSAGTATNLDVLTAQNTSLAARLQLDRERYNYKITYLGILRMTGQLDRAAIDHLEPDNAATQPDSNTAPTTQPAADISPNEEITTVTTTTTTTTTTRHIVPPATTSNP